MGLSCSHNVHCCCCCCCFCLLHMCVCVCFLCRCENHLSIFYVKRCRQRICQPVKFCRLLPFSLHLIVSAAKSLSQSQSQSQRLRLLCVWFKVNWRRRQRRSRCQHFNASFNRFPPPAPPVARNGRHPQPVEGNKETSEKLKKSICCSMSSTKRYSIKN